MNLSEKNHIGALILRGALYEEWQELRQRMVTWLKFLTEGKAFTIAALIFIFLFASLLRAHHFKGSVAFDPSDDTGFFWTESAFQYRYAKMVAEGKRIPDLDPLVQYPQGLRIWENETPVMEYIDGFLYRKLGGGMPFHVFLIYAICFTASLGIFAAYGAAASLWKNRRAGLLSGALYAVSFPSFARIIGNYGREHLALPLLFFSLWWLLGAFQTRRNSHTPWKERGLSLASGAAMGTALASWHLSRFIFLIFSVCIIAMWIYLLFTDKDESHRLAGLLIWLLLPVLAVSFLSPLLRVSRFYFSQGVVVLLTIPLTSYLGRGLSPRKLLLMWSPLVLLLAGGSSVVTTGQEGEYSHVWALMKAKIINFGIKPEDPSRLPFEARLMWIEDFNSPNPRNLIYSYATLPLLAFFGIFFGLKGLSWKKWGGQKVLFLLLLLTFLILYLLIQRMTGFLVFFLIILAAGITVSRRSLIVFLILFCLIFETHKSIYFGQPTVFKTLVDTFLQPKPPSVPNWRSNDLTVIDWIRRHTQPVDAFLASFGTSPAILAYAERPIILQSKVENRNVRERIQSFLEFLYSSEDAFYRYCQENQVRYFLYEASFALDPSTDSSRFMAGHLKLRRDSAAYLFHFQPEQLKRFTLLFQNSFYRIYAVHTLGQTPPHPPLPYHSTYDLSLFGTQEGVYFNDTATPQVMARLDIAVQLYTDVQSLLNAGKINEAIGNMRTALKFNSGIIGLHTDLGLALFHTGRHEEALPYLREEVRVYPDYVLGYYNLGYVLANTGQYEEALQEWKKGLMLDPENAAISDGIRQVKNILELSPGRKNRPPTS